MPKKCCLLLLLGAYLTLVPLVQSETSSQAEIKRASSLLPDSPFYFIKPLAENISLAFTPDAKAKEEKRIDIVEERLAETKYLLEKKRYDLASKNLKRYESSINELSANIDRLKNSGLKIEATARKVEFYTAKHSLVLEKLEDQLPLEIKNDLKKALNASQKAMDRSADVLNKPPLNSELRDELVSLNSVGILSSGDLTSILSLRSREEVRKKLEGLASQEILPHVFIKKLDEAQEKFFPADFAKISEFKKSQERARLEWLKPDELTQTKISEFAATYKAGEIVPPNIKKPWTNLQKRQELQPKTQPDKPVEVSSETQPSSTSQLEVSPSPLSSSQGSPQPSRSPTSAQFGSQCNFASHALGTIFADGKCYYLKCETGWYNNDLDVNNGCESQTDASVSPSPGSSAAGICGSGQVKNEKGECIPENQTCTDTNSAVPFYTKGTCTDITGTYTNYCAGSVSKDYFCQGTWDPATYSSKNHRCVSESFDCAIANTAEPYICAEGACIKASPTPSKSP